MGQTDDELKNSRGKGGDIRGKICSGYGSAGGDEDGY